MTIWQLGHDLRGSVLIQMLLMRTIVLILVLLLPFKYLLKFGKDLESLHNLNHFKDETSRCTDNGNDIEPVVPHLNHRNALTSCRMHTQSDSDLGMFSMEISLRNIPLVARDLTVGVLRILNFDVLVPNLELLHRVNPVFHRFSILLEYCRVVVFRTTSRLLFCTVGRI